MYAYYVYYFFSSAGGGGGGGTGLSSSGRLGAVPSPICSQGESESKFLNGCGHERSAWLIGLTRKRVMAHVPESLSEL